MKTDSKLFYTNITYFIVVIFFVMVRITNSFIDTTGFDDRILDVIFTVIIQIGIMFILPVLLYSKFCKRQPKYIINEFKYKKMNYKAVLICIGLGICCFFLNIAVSSFFSGIIHLFGYESAGAVRAANDSIIPNTSVWALIIDLIIIGVLPAVCEETVHRGMLLNGYSSLGLKRAVLFSALMFGLLHLNINQTGFAFVLGILMALAVVFSQSIWPAIIIHFINNGTHVYLDFAGRANIAGGGFMSWIDNLVATSNMIVVFVVCLLLMTVLVGVMLWLFWLLLKETRIKKTQQMLAQLASVEDSIKLKDLDKMPRSPLAGVKNIDVMDALLEKYNVKTTQNLIFTNTELRFNKPTKWENLLFYGSLILMSLITIFTFIWGVL